MLQGRLQLPAVAALVQAAGASAGWAVAAEAAIAAAATLAAGDGKHLAALGLAEAVASAAGQQLGTGSQLQAAVDARQGSVAVAVDGSQQPLLTATIVAAVDVPVLAHQQCSAHPAGLVAQLLRPTAAAAAKATAVLAAESAQHAQQMHGLFAQPALLQAGAQLQQLRAADSDVQPEPAAFDCLLSAVQRSGAGSSSSSSRRALVSRHGLWHGSACQRTLRLCSGKPCSMQLTGMQWRHAALQRAVPGLSTAADKAAEDRCSYVVSWQTVQPDQLAFAAGRHRQAAAMIAFGGQLPGRTGNQQGRVARIPHSRQRGVQAGQAACLRAMQALQTAAAAGARTLSLTAVGAAKVAAPAALSSSSVALASSTASLFAMLRCATSEMPDVACSAGIIDEVAAGCSLSAAAPWDAAFGCHGQQRSAGQLRAARLLPAAEPQIATQPVAAAQQQQWAVSGGTGSLGLLVTGWLQLRQAGRVLLLGRSGRLTDAAPEALLAADGSLSACMCDAAMREDAAAAMCRSTAGGRPLTGLVHAGGILRDAALQQQTAASIRAVQAPKAAGLVRLLGAAGYAAPLQQALLFSSIAAVTGPAGSSNYAAANAALDVAASQLQLQGERGSVGAVACMRLSKVCPVPIEP